MHGVRLHGKQILTAIRTIGDLTLCTYKKLGSKLPVLFTSFSFTFLVYKGRFLASVKKNAWRKSGRPFLTSGIWPDQAMLIKRRITRPVSDICLHPNWQVLLRELVCKCFLAWGLKDPNHNSDNLRAESELNLEPPQHCITGTGTRTGEGSFL